MRLIQLLGVDGEPVALFQTERKDNDQVDADIQEAFQDAKDMEDQGEDIYVPDEAEAILEKKGITRVFVDEVSTNIL